MLFDITIRARFKSINFDFMTDSVIVEYNPALITKEEIKDRLQNSGYQFVRLAT